MLRKSEVINNTIWEMFKLLKFNPCLPITTMLLLSKVEVNSNSVHTPHTHFATGLKWPVFYHDPCHTRPLPDRMSTPGLLSIVIRKQTLQTYCTKHLMLQRHFRPDGTTFCNGDIGDLYDVTYKSDVVALTLSGVINVPIDVSAPAQKM